MQTQPQDVDRGLEEVCGDALDERSERAIRRNEAPVAVDDERRLRLVAAEDLVDRVPHRPHLRSIEVAPSERRA
jgi:hypothetical protein